MEPTEYEATVAVDAAARKVYSLSLPKMSSAPPFDDLDRLQQNQYREVVLPLVWAALGALPDRAAEPRLALNEVVTTLERGESVKYDTLVRLRNLLGPMEV